MKRKKSFNKLMFDDVKSKLISWKLVQRNGWAIKISITETENILLLFVSRYTGQTILKYCYTEEKAMEEINDITSKNAQLYIDTGIDF